MSWVVSVPVWGDWYRSLFLNTIAGPLCRALLDCHEPAKVLIATDDPGFADVALDGFSITYTSIALGEGYDTLSSAHREALATANDGDKVALLNSDLILSRNFFERANEHLASGKKAIVMLGMRTNPDWMPLPSIRPESLLRWGWQLRHQIVRDLEWGKGGSTIPTHLFWSNEHSVVAHGFHLHPAVLLKEGTMDFGRTIDDNLLDSMDTKYIHVVTQPQDMAFIEVSEQTPLKRCPLLPDGAVMTVKDVASRILPSPLHKWQFRHRIVLVGDGSGIEDMPVVEQILEELG